MKKEVYDFYKSNGICVLCGKQKPRKGMVYCLDCADNLSAYRMKRRKDKHDILLKQERESAQKRRAYRSENHLCFVCGKPLEEGTPFVSCEACRKRSRKYNAKRKRNK